MSKQFFQIHFSHTTKKYSCGILFMFAMLFSINNQVVAANSEKRQGTKIVTSIKPLALLINEIISDDDSVYVLLEKNQNHHITSLKPSQRKAVDQADIVFYIDDDFEFFIKKIKNSDSSKYKYIAVGETSGLRLLSVRESGQLPHVAHENLLKKKRDDGHHHHHSGVDWHLWLNPDNAIVMLMKIRDELTKFRPENEIIYQERYELFSQHLIKNSMKKAKKMMEVLNSPFFVLHDGLQYFEEQYGLESKGTILRDEEASASAKHLSKLRKIRRANKVNIVIKEEQYSDRAIQTLAGDSPFKIINVDSLAQGSLSQVEDYIEYIDAITEIIFLGLSK